MKKLFVVFTLLMSAPSFADDCVLFGRLPEYGSEYVSTQDEGAITKLLAVDGKNLKLDGKLYRHQKDGQDSDGHYVRYYEFENARMKLRNQIYRKDSMAFRVMHLTSSDWILDGKGWHYQFACFMSY